MNYFADNLFSVDILREQLIITGLLPNKNIEMSVSSKQSRLYYLDNLRCYAMLMGVFLHIAIAYGDNIGKVWYVQDSQSTKAMEVGIWFIHLFRMALFFFISGYFSNLVIQKKGIKHFIKARYLKLFLPFFLFMPLLVLAMNGVVLFASNYLESEQKMLHMFIATLQKTNYELSHFRTFHLWFLYYLILFSLLAVLVQRLHGTYLMRKITNLFSSSFSPLIILVAIIPSHYFGTFPFSAPESLIPEVGVFGYYGVFYLYGWFFFNNESSIDLIKRYTKVTLLLILISYAVLYHYLPSFSAKDPIVYSTELKLFLAVLESFCAVSLVLLAVIGAKTYLVNENYLANYFSKASYVVYLVHLPVVIFVQVLMADFDINVWLKFMIATVFSLGLSVLCYEFFKYKSKLVSFFKPELSKIVPLLK